MINLFKRPADNREPVEMHPDDRALILALIQETGSVRRWQMYSAILLYFAVLMLALIYYRTR